MSKPIYIFFDKRYKNLKDILYISKIK